MLKFMKNKKIHI